MCVFKKPKMQQQQKAPAVLPQPERTAEPTEVGEARKAEDKELFPGGTPELRTDRSATGSGIAASGTGLRMT